MNEYEVYIPGMQKVSIWADRIITEENGQILLWKKMKSDLSACGWEDVCVAVIPKGAFIKVNMFNNKPV